MSESAYATKNEFKIIPATWKDLGAFRYLEKISFPKDAWPLLDMIAVLSLPKVVRLKAVLDDLMVGFIAGEHRVAEKTAWIATLAVHPEYRRRGIATSLLLACEEQLILPKIRLTVRVENVAAQELYIKSGYQKVGIWPKYYSGGGDALLLEKENQNSV